MSRAVVVPSSSIAALGGTYTPPTPAANAPAGLATATGTAQPPPFTSTPFIAGLATDSTGGHFTDQHGSPRLWVATETWCLPVRAGEWNSGNWQADYDNFFSARAAQGVTVTMTSAFESATDTFSAAPFANGNTWDGFSPWANGTDASAGLGSTVWGRIDYMFNSALASGITIGLDILDSTSFLTGGPFATWNTTQMQAFAEAVATRYASQPNLVWMFGNDVIPPNESTFFDAFLAGLAAVGDTHAVIAWWQEEYTSRYNTDGNSESTWGTAHSQANFCYTYNCGYWIIEYAYNEVTAEGASGLLPVMWGDGYWFAGESTYDFVNDRAWRQEIWWVLASGGRGILTESNNVFKWSSSADVAAVTTDWSFVNALPHITSYYQSLPEWHLLLPDLASAFVTSGRGTRIGGRAGSGGAQYEPAFSNAYVAASLTADGKLAVLYLPVSTTITVNTSLLASGWSANWVDPITCATSSAGTSGTYNSTAKGNSSQGDPDWVLVFQAP